MLTNSEFLPFSARSAAHFCPSCPVSYTLGVSDLRFPQGNFFFIFVTIIIIFNWRIIALKCIGFYRATMWITHNYICIYIYIYIYISPPSWVSLPPPLLTFYFILEYNIFQYIVTNNIVLISDVQQSDSVIHIHASVLFQILFPIRLLQNIEQSSLCYTIGPWLSILNIAVQFQWIKMCSTPLHHVPSMGQN